MPHGIAASKPASAAGKKKLDGATVVFRMRRANISVTASKSESHICIQREIEKLREKEGERANHK